MALEGANKDLGQDAIPKGIVARGRELIGAALANRFVQLGMGASFGLYRMSRASVPFTPMNVASGIAVTTAAVEGTRVAVKGIQTVYGLLNRQSEVEGSEPMDVSESDGDCLFFSTKELKRKRDAEQSSEKLNISVSESSEGDEIVENESPADEAPESALDSETTEVYMTDAQSESSASEERIHLDKVQAPVVVEEAQVPAEQAQAPAEQAQASVDRRDESEASDPFVGEPSPKRPRVDVKSEVAQNSLMETDFVVPQVVAPQDTPPLVIPESSEKAAPKKRKRC